MTEIYTTIDGEDYIIRVTGYTPGDPGSLYGPPENCYPPSGPYADFVLIDEMTGEPADDVACKHYDRIISEIEEQAAGIADDYEGA